MAAIQAFWLPIILSAITVFLASSVLWMATPLHKHDYKGLPNEAAFLDAVRTMNAAPHRYMFPWNAGKDWKDPAHLAKMKARPCGSLTITDGAPNFGRSLFLWFVHQLVLAVFIAYVAGNALLTAGIFGWLWPRVVGG